MQERSHSLELVIPEFEQAPEAKPALVFRLVEEVKTKFRLISAHFFDIGRILLFLKQENRYLSYSEGHIGTWEEFCKEIGMGKSTANNLMRIVAIFGPHMIQYDNVSKFPVDYTRLARLLPHTKQKSKEEIETLLDDAKTLTPVDFEAKLRELHGKMPYYNCDHKPEHLKEYVECEECGMRWGKDKEVTEPATDSQ